MARSRAADPSAPALFAVEDPHDGAPADAPRVHRPGRHEKMARKALAAAPHLQADHLVAARSALLSMAAALDVAEARQNAYAVAQLARPHRELLSDLGLLPVVAREGGGDDGFGDIGAAELADTT